MEKSCSGFSAETKDGEHDAGRNRQYAYARRDLNAILFLHDRLNRPDTQNFLVPVVSELRVDQRRSPQDDQNDSAAGENFVGHAWRVYHTVCPLEAASWLRAHPCADDDAGECKTPEQIQLSAAGSCGRARDWSLPVAPGPVRLGRSFAHQFGVQPERRAVLVERLHQ